MAGGLKPARPRAARRRAAWLAVVAAVVAAHVWVSRDMSARFADLRSAAAMPARIEVAYVNEMKQTAPVISTVPVAAPAPAAVAAATSAMAVEAAASQAQAEAAERAEQARAKAARDKAAKAKAERAARAEAKAREDREAQARAVAARAERAELQARALAAAQAASAASDPARAVDTASIDAAGTDAPSPPAAFGDAGAAAATGTAASAASAAASQPSTLAAAGATPPDPAASGAKPFEWPVSTRVSYVLTGYYRGDVQGWAKVEWVKAGSRYQVHLDVTIGPDFAPLIYRRMSSDGEITTAGLSPRRYDEETKVVFRDTRRNTVVLDGQGVTLPDGSRHDRRPNMQDQASQFVQLTYLFSTQPGLLAPGRTITMPLALPRRIDDWQYEVMENEAVAAPFGSVPAVHVRPRRRSGESVGSSGNELTAEVWFAPTLAYLPVRIRIQQVGENFLDLVIAKPPEQAGP